jgi:putative nucleotidyltransferase with HDIG domain
MMSSFRSQIPTPVLWVVETLQRNGHHAHVVGGCVRDLLMGRAPEDWDVTTSALPAETAALFPKVIPTGMKHGTVTVLVDEEPIEVTTYRSDGDYSDGRRPDDVRFGASLHEDLSRRDFTMNAIAFDPMAEVLVDPFDGAKDIGRGSIRAVGAARDRFSEDGLRAMRALRFMATLQFELDPSVRLAIAETLPILGKVSVERFRDELLKLLGAEQPAAALEAAQRTGALAVFIPELDAGVGCTQNRHHRHDVWTHTVIAVEHTVGDPIRRLGALLHDVGKPATRAPYADRPGEFSFLKHELAGAEMSASIAERLRLSSAEQQRVVGMVEHHMFSCDPGQKPAGMRRFLRRVGPELVPDLLALRIGDVVGKGLGEDGTEQVNPFSEALERLQREPQLLSTRDLAIDGRDVMRALAVAPGPRVGAALKALLERVTEHPELNTREALLALLPELPATC